MKEVESFKLDHTKVKAPYVRAAGVLTRDGVAVSKFDLRLTQPNKEFISPLLFIRLSIFLPLSCARSSQVILS